MQMGGGYINIVLRRDQTLGWRGDIGTEAGFSDDWSGRANGSVSYASDKFDMTIDAHGGRTTQTTDDLTTYCIEEDANIVSDTHAKQTDKQLAANLTLRYLPSKNLELGGMFSWQTLWPEKVISGQIVNFFGHNPTSEAYLEPHDNTTTKSLTAYCDWHLDSKGKLISLTYQNYKKDDNCKSGAFSKNMGTNSNYDIPIVNWEGYSHDVDYRIQSVRLDMTLPFSSLNIDAGASYTYVKNLADLLYNTSSEYSKYLFVVSNILDYKEKAKAAYLSINHDWRKFSLKAGLRYEHIGWDEGSDSKDYWLPSLSMSYKPKDGHQINLSWGTSCLHTNFYDLNPLRVYKSIYEYKKGNPLLKPNRISNIELNYLNHHGFYTCAYHHHGSNMIIWQTDWRILEYGDVSLSDHAQSWPQNIGRINQTGFYLRYQRQLSEHLTATAEGDAFYHDATSQYNEESHLYGWGKRMAISADWYLNSQHTLLLNARYQHWFADYHEMTETDGYGYFYFALRYTMPGDRLKLSLVANDPFHQFVTDETINNSIVAYNNASNDITKRIKHLRHINHHAHYIGFTATYSLGGKKVRQTRHSINDSESKRAEKQ